MILAGCAAGLVVLAAGAVPADDLPPERPAEAYVYEARPTGRRGGEPETITVQLAHEDGNMAYAAQVRGARTEEHTRIQTTSEGTVLAAERQLLDEKGKRVSQASLRREDGHLVLRRDRNSKAHKTVPVPGKEKTAVDASLLLLLRHYPFEQPETWRIRMVDFSGRTVHVSVRWAGMDTVVVPAGTFDCHRMELEVAIPLLRPHITYWLAVAPPHFLVRHRGKRGPFTPEYDTRLLRLP